MERLTTNKSVADMSMIELAHNSCYADDERNVRYRDYDMEMDDFDSENFEVIGNMMESEAINVLNMIEAHGDLAIKAKQTAINALEEVQQYRAAVEKQKIDKELESHDEKHILKYCINLMQELVGKFEEWYEYVHGEDAIKELCEDEKFCYRMTYSNIVQELFLFGTSHSGGTSTRAKCKQLGVDSSDEIEFSFGDDEE